MCAAGAMLAFVLVAAGLVMAGTVEHTGRAAAGPPHTFSPGYFQELKACVHQLPPAEATDRVLNVAPHPPPPRGQDKIEHFVVLFMENRGFDNLLGCMLGDTPGVDGIPSGGRQIPVDSDDPTKGTVNISCGTAKYVCTGGMDYDFFQGKTALGGNSYSHPCESRPSTPQTGLLCAADSIYAGAVAAGVLQTPSNPTTSHILGWGARSPTKGTHCLALATRARRCTCFQLSRLVAAHDRRQVTVHAGQ
jgi:hypothetical protein